MKRRGFIGALFAGLGTALTGRAATAARRPLVIQESQVAGFEYYRGDALWPALRVGAKLTLVREPHNRFDHDAVAVYYRAEKLGFVPQLENVAVAQMLDRGERLRADIVRLNEDGHPWGRVRMRIWAV